MKKEEIKGILIGFGNVLRKSFYFFLIPFILNIFFIFIPYDLTFEKFWVKNDTSNAVAEGSFFESVSCFVTESEHESHLVNPFEVVTSNHTTEKLEASFLSYSIINTLYYSYAHFIWIVFFDYLIPSHPFNIFFAFISCIVAFFACLLTCAVVQFTDFSQYIYSIDFGFLGTIQIICTLGWVISYATITLLVTTFKNFANKKTKFRDFYRVNAKRWSDTLMYFIFLHWKSMIHYLFQLEKPTERKSIKSINIIEEEEEKEGNGEEKESIITSDSNKKMYTNDNTDLKQPLIKQQSTNSSNNVKKGEDDEENTETRIDDDEMKICEQRLITVETKKNLTKEIKQNGTKFENLIELIRWKFPFFLVVRCFGCCLYMISIFGTWFYLQAFSTFWMSELRESEVAVYLVSVFHVSEFLIERYFDILGFLVIPQHIEELKSFHQFIITCFFTLFHTFILVEIDTLEDFFIVCLFETIYTCFKFPLKATKLYMKVEKFITNLIFTIFGVKRFFPRVYKEEMKKFQYENWIEELGVEFYLDLIIKYASNFWFVFWVPLLKYHPYNCEYYPIYRELNNTDFKWLMIQIGFVLFIGVIVDLLYAFWIYYIVDKNTKKEKEESGNENHHKDGEHGHKNQFIFILGKKETTDKFSYLFLYSIFCVHFLSDVVMMVSNADVHVRNGFF